MRGDATVATMLPPRKRLAHRLKAALYRSARLDAFLDDHLTPAVATQRPSALSRAYLRLLPERALRATPLGPGPATRAPAALLLTLVPPEDTGGGSRPAQLAAGLQRRGFAIDWRYALPIFPWPRRRRPVLPGVSVRALGAGDDVPATAPSSPAFVLIEAPHPLLAAELAALPPDVTTIYDAIDVWDGSLGAGWYDRATEDALLRRASALVASSCLLRDELALRTGRPVELLPNGVDPRVFDARVARAVPPDLRRGEPTVLYVGSLWGEWVDLDLIAAVAHALPRAAFNLIGPAGTRRLPSAPNIAILGARAQRDVPAYLQAADVAIVPFASGRLSAAVSPLKAFEYLAMERPVVATPLPELDGVPGVTIARGVEAFAAAIGDAARTTFPRADAAAFVARQTWQERVDRLVDISSRCERIATGRKD
jgi:glycosyltransferase involved in cell wall biosynthesis